MSPQLHSVLAKVLDEHYRGDRDPKYVIAALIRIAAEPSFATKLSVESLRAAAKQLREELGDPVDFTDAIRDPRKSAILEQYSIARSSAIRRSNGRDPIPLLVEEDE
jgi:hypothetical protein